MLYLIWLCALALPTSAPTSAPTAPATIAPTTQPTFTNPIIKQEAGDPWVEQKDGFYYFTATMGSDKALWIWKSKTLTGLDGGEKVKVWSAPETGPMSRKVWAPELHWIAGHWYLYFCASDVDSRNHRIYCLQADGDDPLGSYTMKGRVDQHDGFELDGSVLQMSDGKLFWMYSDGRLHLAPMSSPTTADESKAIVLSTATEPWEHGWIEGPEPLVHDGHVFIVYSAGDTFSPHYCLGMLTFKGGDPLDAKNWIKSPQPVFAPYQGPDGAVYTVGHNGFTKSVDGTEDWIIYHAKDFAARHSAAGRTIRIQKFTWNADGSPDFGHPIPAGVAIERPSGE
jgi:GH43 family beta-xylosidase